MRLASWCRPWIAIGLQDNQLNGLGVLSRIFIVITQRVFDNRGDHIYAENWLNNVEELLATLGCRNEQKVAYAAYKLTGEAKGWWQDKKVMLVVDMGSETAISWEVFKHKFNRYFFS